MRAAGAGPTEGGRQVFKERGSNEFAYLRTVIYIHKLFLEMLRSYDVITNDWVWSHRRWHLGKSWEDSLVKGHTNGVSVI
jgi:hypothetical protein